MAPTTFKWVKGHSGNQGNEESDALTKEGATKDAPNELSLHILRPPGHKANNNDASTCIPRHNGPPTAPMQNLEQTRRAIQIYQGSLEMDEAIWQSIQKCTIRLRAQQYLYKAMHNTPMVGNI